MQIQGCCHSRDRMEGITYVFQIGCFRSALLLAGVLSSPASAQESAAEKAREKQADTAAAENAYKEPRMAAALTHLRQAEEEL
jgi:Zn-dependent protease with chaperone function